MPQSEETIATPFQLAGESLLLDARRAIFWPSQRCLLLADLHFGKAAHFRREGLAVPPQVALQNQAQLVELLEEYVPERVLFVGDLFHSDYNEAWEELGDILTAFSNIQFELVKGNHDILDDRQYQKFGLQVHPLPLPLGPFLLSHEPLDTPHDHLYNLAGHLHPGVILRGRGHQSLRLPCFFFGQQQGILPAFGAFTGLAIMKARPGDQVFVIAEERVIKV